MGCQPSKNPHSLSAIGAVGELWLEGPIVGAGYLDPEKTASAFAENPSWLLCENPHPSEIRGRRGRFYRTGDLVRYNTDGSLVFVGRKDAQVKLRGQRVKLEEVQHYVQETIMAKTGERCRVVAEVVQPKQSTNPTLVAFILTKSGTVGSSDDEPATQISRVTAEVGDRLRGFLPAYLVPAAYIPLPHIPMTPTGKMDRRQLREIGASIELAGLSNASGGKRKAGSSTATTPQEKTL